MEEASLLSTEITVIAILIVVSLVAVAVRRVRVPYTVALVLVGLALSAWGFLYVEMTPELVLALFLPPLLFEAAFHIQVGDLRVDAGPILTLAVVGVLLSTALLGYLLFVASILPLPVALLFAALISATDPVSVIATFKALGAPRRLTTLVEGESLFNDGTAIVVFQIMTLLALGGTLDPLRGLLDFVRISAGGILIGLLLGLIAAELIGRIDDYLIETTLTTVLAYGAYLLAEQFHVSGVLAVVMAGLVNGNIGHRRMSPTTQIVLLNFWEYLAFLANSFVFLLIGMNVRLEELIANAYAIGGAIAGVLVVRAFTVYGLSGLLRLIRWRVPTAYQHVLFWGGLRGAVSLALAFSLVEMDIPYRQELLAMTFGVVLFTLLVQGTTVQFLITRLGLAGRSEVFARYQHLQGELLGIRAAQRHLDTLHEEGAIIPQAWTRVKQELARREKRILADMDTLLVENPEVESEIVTLARVEALRAARAALTRFGQEGLLGHDVVARLIADIDAALEHPDQLAKEPDEEP